MRIVVAIVGIIAVTLAPSFPTMTYVAGYTLMLAVALGELLLVRRPPPWLNAVTCLFDITLLNVINVTLVVTGSPLAVTNSRAFFTVTFLILSLTCLRQDARLALLSGVVAIVQYGLIVLWVASRFDLERHTASRELFGAFNWSNQFTRLALLAVATAINVAIIKTSRAYWRDSVHDWLTGLVNRRYAEKRLEEALAAAKRSGHPLVLALADVDRFKQINDAYGHPAGDRVLRNIASALKAAFRSSDVLARFGGDEFFILLPESDVEATLDRLSRFHAGLAIADPVRTTVSMGVATWPADGNTPMELFAAADKRLYAAKEAGRDRVVLPLATASGLSSATQTP
jgi:diguanylate cyclase (GGDEF)-like protein